MATTYSFQKGKYGGYVGCIFPFFRTISTDSPLDQEFFEYIPAGYLKCKGQILSADQYPNLATILGVGQACIYRKEGTTLSERNAVSGLGGQIQLPDLGSKYITATSTPGGYLNITTTNPTTNAVIYRAGVEVSLSSIAQNNLVTFNYTGNFAQPETAIPISGTIAVRSSSSTNVSSVFETQILAHGHMTGISTAQSIGSSNMYVKDTPQRRIFCRGANTDGGENVPSGLQWVTNALSEVGTQAGTSHSHSGLFPAVTRGAGSSYGTSGMARTLIPSDGLITSVRLNTDTTFKLDYITPKFILCEYLIKF
jgi:hypothetical protein